MRKKRSSAFFIGLFVFVLFLPGCVQSITRNMIIKMIVTPAFDTFLQERDLDLAWRSIGSQLKLVEIILHKENDAKRRSKLNLVLCQGFASYALLMEPKLREIKYASDNAENAEKKKVIDQQFEQLEKRMRILSLRGREACFRVLEERYKGFSQAAQLGRPAYAKILAKTTKEDLPFLFWGGFAWGYALINGLSDTNLTAQIPQLKQLMARCVKIDGSYFYGGSHIFLATFFAQSPTLGGNLKLAKKHFAAAHKISNKQALITHYYEARFYSQQANDTKGCKVLLNHVKKAPIDKVKNLTLMNAWTKAMTRVALKDTDEFCP